MARKPLRVFAQVMIPSRSSSATNCRSVHVRRSRPIDVRPQENCAAFNVSRIILRGLVGIVNGGIIVVWTGGPVIPLDVGLANFCRRNCRRRISRSSHLRQPYKNLDRTNSLWGQHAWDELSHRPLTPTLPVA